MPTETGIETQLKEAAQLFEAVWAVLAERVGGEWLLRFDYRLSKSAQNELMTLLAKQVIDTWLCGALSGGYARSSAIPDGNDLNVKRFFAFPDVYAAGVPQGDDIAAGVTVRYGGGVAPAFWSPSGVAAVPSEECLAIHLNRISSYIRENI